MDAMQNVWDKKVSQMYCRDSVSVVHWGPWKPENICIRIGKEVSVVRLRPNITKMQGNSVCRTMWLFAFHSSSVSPLIHPWTNDQPMHIPKD
jgi:hypothetical protein